MPSTKKRIATQCREVMLSLNNVSEKYHEFISSALGNTFLFVNDTEKEEVRDTLRFKERPLRTVIMFHLSMVH